MTSQTGAAAYCQRLSIWQPTVMNEGGLPSSTAHINQEFKEDYYDWVFYLLYKLRTVIITITTAGITVLLLLSLHSGDVHIWLQRKHSQPKPASQSSNGGSRRTWTRRNWRRQVSWDVPWKPADWRHQSAPCHRLPVRHTSSPPPSVADSLHDSNYYYYYNIRLTAF